MNEKEFQKEFAAIKVKIKKTTNAEEKSKLTKKLWKLVEEAPPVRMKII